MSTPVAWLPQNKITILFWVFFGGRHNQKKLKTAMKRLDGKLASCNVERDEIAKNYIDSMHELETGHRWLDVKSQYTGLHKRIKRKLLEENFSTSIESQKNRKHRPGSAAAVLTKDRGPGGEKRGQLWVGDLEDSFQETRDQMRDNAAKGVNGGSGIPSNAQSK
jgi:hypothetical protein